MKLRNFDNFVVESTNAAKEALKLGLTYNSFGYWKDPRTDKVTHKTENGELIPYDSDAMVTPDSGGAVDPDVLSRKNMMDQPTGPKPMPGSGIKGAPEPGTEQHPRGANWNPGPDGDNCVNDQPAPEDKSFDMFVSKPNYYKWVAGADGSNYQNLNFKDIAKEQPSTTQTKAEKKNHSFNTFLSEDEGGQALTTQMGTPSPRGAGGIGNSEKLKQQGFQHRGFNNYSRQDGTSAKIIAGEIIYYNSNGEVSSEDSGGLKVMGAKPTWKRETDGQAMTPPAAPETPEEIAAVPDPIPSNAPMGYDKMMQQKAIEAAEQMKLQNEIQTKKTEIDDIYAGHPLSRAFKIRMDNVIADANQSSRPGQKIFATHLQDVVNEYAGIFSDIITGEEDEEKQTKLIALIAKTAQADATSRMSDIVESRPMSFSMFLKESDDEFASLKGMDPAKLKQLRMLADKQENPALRAQIVKNATNSFQRSQANQPNQTQQPQVAPTPDAAADGAAVRRRAQGIGPRGTAQDPNPKKRGKPDLDSLISNIQGTDSGAGGAKPPAEKPVASGGEEPEKGMSLKDFQASRRPGSGKDRQAAWDASQDPKNAPGVDPQEYDRQQKAVDDMDPTDKALMKTSPEATELGDTLEKKRQAKAIKLAQQMADVEVAKSPVDQQETASAIAMMDYLRNPATSMADNEDLFKKVSSVFPGIVDKQDWLDTFTGQGQALRKSLGLGDDDVDEDWAVERTASRNPLSFIDKEDQQDIMQYTWDRSGDGFRKLYGGQLDSFNPADLTFARKSQLGNMKGQIDKLVDEFGDNPELLAGVLNTYMGGMENAGNLHRASLKQGDTEKGVPVQGKPVNMGDKRGYDLDYDADGNPRLFSGGFLDGKNPRTSLGIAQGKDGSLGFDSHSFLMSPYFESGGKTDRYSIENKVSSLMGDAVESRELPEADPEKVPWRSIKGGQSSANARGGGIPVQELGQLIRDVTGEDINYRLGVKQKTKRDGSAASGFEPDQFNDDDKKYWGDMLQGLMDENDGNDNPFFNFGDGPSFNGEKMSAHDWVSRTLDMANSGADGDSKHESKFTNGLRSKLRQFRLMQMMQKAKQGDKGDLPKLLARLKYMAKKQGVDGDMMKGGYTLYQ